MEVEIHVPVLLIAFNRPDTTTQVFDRLRIAKPQKLYVVVDGPREGKEGEEGLVNQVKEILQNVDWKCKTYYKFNDTNKGAEVTVSSAISWVFEKEEYAVILEDDIIAPLAFLKFAQEMLIKYKDDERISTVTGSNFTPIPVLNNTDYFFAKYGHSGGGWATWKRVWDRFDLNVEIPKKHVKKTFLKDITNSSSERNVFCKKFKAIRQKGPGKSTWDEISFYFQMANKKLSIIPRVNLTSNIGVWGLHAKGQSEHHFRSFDETFEVINHPEKVECNIEYDKHHFKSYINKKASIFKNMIHKINKINENNEKLL